ncbi:reprolysin-like metallopeptidase [Archangium lansingense]|uniref:reprolysin-like metallopeptidase n=1 Tax=Archangium lansingense TaxID=2995310 RepID=UPI003B7DCD90
MKSSWRPTWQTVAEGSVENGGLSEWAQAPLWADAGSVALRVSEPGGTPVCVQLHEVRDEAGSAWVTPPASLEDYGPYCRSCPERVSVGVGAGLYVLPSGDPPPPRASRLEVRMAARECSTFLPTRPGEHPKRMRLEVMPLDEVEETREGVVLLEVAITSGSVFHEDSEPLPAGLIEALGQVNALLGPGRLSVRPVRVIRVEAEDPLDFERGNHAALERLHGTLHASDEGGRAPDDRWVPLVLAGCLRLTDPVQKKTSEPEGFVPHIPDGLAAPGRAHGVFIRGRACRDGAEPITWPTSYLARLIAHELGHYLGLYHSVEEDGTTDLLEDTDADNLMSFRPSTTGSPAFSASQFRIMRRHPAVRWEE